MAIVKHHPETRATVFDFPGVVEETDKRFQASEWSDRLNTIGGDVMESDFPKGYDSIMFSHFIDIFSPENNKQFFRKAYDSLRPGGQICIFTPVVNPDENELFTYCVFASYFLCLANGEGRFYKSDSIREWLLETGFTKIRKHYLPIHEVVLWGTKP
jgi:cyclopropane fatty-acyl-phospholipid synthase-like methyltransferase